MRSIIIPICECHNAEKMFCKPGKGYCGEWNLDKWGFYSFKKSMMAFLLELERWGKAGIRDR